jgi:hypothetical protein
MRRSTAYLVALVTGSCILLTSRHVAYQQDRATTNAHTYVPPFFPLHPPPTKSFSADRSCSYPIVVGGSTPSRTATNSASPAPLVIPIPQRQPQQEYHAKIRTLCLDIYTLPRRRRGTGTNQHRYPPTDGFHSSRAARRRGYLIRSFSLLLLRTRKRST